MKKLLFFTILVFLFNNNANANYTSNSVIETKAGEPLFDECIKPLITGTYDKPNRCFDNEYNPLNATVKAYRYNYQKYERQLYFIGTFEDGYLNGEVTVFKQDGGKNVFNFKNHKLNGITKLYDNFGRLRKTMDFVNGYEDGYEIEFYENGNKSGEELFSKGYIIQSPKHYDNDGTHKNGLYTNKGGNLTLEILFYAGNLVKYTTYKNNGDIKEQISEKITELTAKGQPIFKAVSGFCYKEIINSNGQREIKKIEFTPMHLYKINSLGIIEPCESFNGIDHGI